MSIDNKAVFGKAYSAFLFDMDGTLLTSTIAAERVWGEWAQRHGLDVAAFLPTLHGKRAIDTISQLNLPGVDAEKEAALVTQAEIDDVDGIAAITGAAAFLERLPADRWAIVTSAPETLARRRLAAAGVSLPRLIITADDVSNGKPDPEGYLLAAKRLGLATSECLVFEDVPAGIAAGEAAGADVMVITATHLHPVETGHAKITDYRDLDLHVDTATGKLSLSRN